MSPGDSSLPCDIKSLRDLRKVVDFQFKFLSCWEDRSGNFQALYISDWNHNESNNQLHRFAVIMTLNVLDKLTFKAWHISSS